MPPATVTVVAQVLAGRCPPARVPRCTITLRHYRRRTETYSPTAQAVSGALDIYAEGQREQDVPRMLFGLSILHSATAAQVDAALGLRRSAGWEIGIDNATEEPAGPGTDL